MQQNSTPNHGNRRHTTNNIMRVRTLVLVAFFVIFGFGLLVYQLYALQLRDPESNRIKATEQQLSDTQVAATRGSILSATGKVFAKSSVVWDITADPSQCNQSYVAQASTDIANIINEGGGSVTAEEIQTKLSDAASQYKVIAKGLTMPTAEAVMEYANTRRNLTPDDPDAKSEKQLSFYSSQSATREYPYASFLSSVLGFCDGEGQGIYGLEKSYNTELSGTPGRTINSQNAWGYELSNEDSDVHDPIDGYNLNLTVDENIQSVVETYLNSAVEEYNVQGRGCALVMNVKTGAILAMATSNQFDPNEPYVIADERMEGILDTPALDAASIDWLQSRLGEDNVADIVADGAIGEDEYTTLQGMLREAQWKNKNATELYYPGSVFKLVTAASALDSGLMDASQQFYCGGELTVFEGTEWEHPYHCAEGETHGWLDLAGALNHSCNLYFIQAAEKMSVDFFYSYYQAFGLTKTTGIDLPHESAGISYTKAQLEQVATNLYSTAFGQSQKITPIQMATAVAATVNGGYLVTPYVVDSVTDTSGNVVKKSETAIRRQVISEEVSEQIRAMMANNVAGEGDYHSCKNAYVAGYQVGGKSGTAEQLDRDYRGDGDFHKAISFTGITPTDDPEILVFVMMDDPRWVEDYASQIVAPVVGNIISEVAPYLGIAKDPNYTASSRVTVPNAVGTRWTAAQVQLNALGLSHKLVGPSGEIVYQYPYVGTEVPAGSTVYFYTDTDQDATTTVPDATGKSGSIAVQMMKAAGLNPDLQGDANARVTTQSMEQGSTAPYGAIVTLQTEAAAAEPAETPATGAETLQSEEPPAQDTPAQ